MTCTGTFSDAYNCTVVVASIMVYTDGDETYDELVTPIIKGSLHSGQMNDVHPAIVNVAYLDQPGDTNNTSAPENGDVDNTGLIIAVCVGATAFLVGVVIIIVVASRFWRKKRLAQSVTATDAASPTEGRDIEKLPSSVYVTRDRLRSVLSNGPSVDDDMDVQPTPPVRNWSLEPN